MTELFHKKVYMVVENPNEDDAAIELTGGKWDGLVYQYGKIQFEEGKPNINFTRTIRRFPHGHDGWKTEIGLEELLNNSELNDLMGDILMELVEEQMKREKEDGTRVS
jgi:hypothetical protein